VSDITRDQLPINQIKNAMEQWNYENTRWSIDSNGDFDPYKYQNRLLDLVRDENNATPQFKRGGYYLLPGAFDLSSGNDERLSTVFFGGEGMKSTITVPDAKEDNAFQRSYDQKLNLAVMNNYPAIFRAFGRDRSTEMIDSQKDLLKHVINQLGPIVGSEQMDHSINNASKMLWGKYFLHKNGGFSNPNGIGTVYRRSAMEKYGLNMDIIDENQFNTWYRAHNVHGKQLRFTLDPEFKKRNPKMASSTVEAVVDGIFKNNGNIWIATINDLYNSNNNAPSYRNILVAQRGDQDTDRGIAGNYLYNTPYTSQPSVQILANLMVAEDDPNATWKPLINTEEEQMLALAEAEASEHLDAHMDPWDQWTFFFNQNKKTVSMFGINNPWPVSLLPYVPGSNFWSNMKLMMEDMGLMTPGRDMSRKRVKHYYDKYGPKSELYGKDEQKGLASNLLGFGHDFSDPKQVEMDLVWIPLWDMIQEWEINANKKKEVEGKPSQYIEAPEAVVASLFEQRRREMFTGRIGTKERRVFSVYDAVQYNYHEKVKPRYFHMDSPAYIPLEYMHYNPPVGEELFPNKKEK
jgi:hypothetical protein